MKVLIVDDQRVNRTLPAVLLKQKGCEVQEAECGADALQLLATQVFDAILLDVSMPGISGTELCRELRARPDFAAVRIVAYTAHALPGERADILAAGFDDILIKPINRQVLLAALGLG
jgi:CheY-like chemotaxis protein